MESYVKVKWLKPHSSFAYFEGQTGHISSAWAAKLLPQGFIMIVPDVDLEIDPALTPSPASPASPPKGGEDPLTHGPEENTLPDDMPGREKLFESGYKTLEAVKGIADPLDVGLSKTITAKLKKYLKDK